MDRRVCIRVHGSSGLDLLLPCLPVAAACVNEGLNHLGIYLPLNEKQTQT